MLFMFFIFDECNIITFWETYILVSFSVVLFPSEEEDPGFDDNSLPLF